MQGGACLTVIAKSKEPASRCRSRRETLARTTLGSWEKGTRINLERALKAGDELGGHLVSGHVDGVSTVEKMEKRGESKGAMVFPLKLVIARRQQRRRSNPVWIAALPAVARNDTRKKSLMRLIAPKGSVTLDGVSLTVNDVKGRHFSVNIIPHTLKATTLGGLKKGSRVNLEVDLIARYLARQKAV